MPCPFLFGPQSFGGKGRLLPARCLHGGPLEGLARADLMWLGVCVEARFLVGLISMENQSETTLGVPNFMGHPCVWVFVLDMLLHLCLISVGSWGFGVGCLSGVRSRSTCLWCYCRGLVFGDAFKMSHGAVANHGRESCVWNICFGNEPCGADANSKGRSSRNGSLRIRCLAMPLNQAH